MLDLHLVVVGAVLAQVKLAGEERAAGEVD
jgi:hypothetical protein